MAGISWPVGNGAYANVGGGTSSLEATGVGLMVVLIAAVETGPTY